MVQQISRHTIKGTNLKIAYDRNSVAQSRGRKIELWLEDQQGTRLDNSDPQYLLIANALQTALSQFKFSIDLPTTDSHGAIYLDFQDEHISSHSGYTAALERHLGQLDNRALDGLSLITDGSQVETINVAALVHQLGTLLLKGDLKPGAKLIHSIRQAITDTRVDELTTDIEISAPPQPVAVIADTLSAGDGIDSTKVGRIKN